jgi:hypothetical protein
VYSALKYNSQNFSLEESLTEENKFAAEIQVYFVVLHEFAHYLLNESYAMLKEHCNRLKESIARLMNSLLDDLCVNADADTLDNLLKLKNDENLIEECCCDTIALTFILSRLKNTVDSFDKKKDVVKAIRWQLNTLSIFSLIENDDISEISRFTSISFIRTGVFRAHLGVFFDESKFDEINLLLDELDNKCTEKFYDLFFESFFNVNDEIKCLKTNIENTVQYNKFSDLYEGLAYP